MAKSKLVKANEKVADAVVDGYKKIEEDVTGAFKKVEDGFVDQFLTHEGESVEDAKKRLAEEQALVSKLKKKLLKSAPLSCCADQNFLKKF